MGEIRKETTPAIGGEGTHSADHRAKAETGRISARWHQACGDAH